MPKKGIILIIILLIITFILVGWEVRKVEEKNYESLCEAYEQSNYENMKKYAKEIRNFSKYPKVAVGTGGGCNQP